MKKLKIGLIGAGNMGFNHARVVHSRPEAELAWIHDLDQFRAIEVCDMLNLDRKLAIHTPLDQPLPDAVIIATPMYSHGLALEWALSHGVHVLVEKPLSDDQESVTRLFDLMRDSDCFSMIGFTERHNPVVNTIDQMFFDEFRFGKLPNFRFIRQSITTNRDNIVLDTMIHDIDLAFGFAHNLDMVEALMDLDSYRVTRSGENALCIENEHFFFHSQRMAGLKSRRATIRTPDLFVSGDLLNQRVIVENSANSMSYDMGVSGPEPLAKQLSTFATLIKWTEENEHRGSVTKYKREESVHHLAFGFIEKAEEYENSENSH